MPVKTMLRNLARKHANRMLVRSNDNLRRELIRAEATIDRQTQTLRRGERTVIVARAELDEATTTIKELRDELRHKDDQIERQADLFEQYRADQDDLRRRFKTVDLEWSRFKTVVELAQSWRSYYHAPDPEPEVWARLESALGRAIDALPSADAAGVAGPEARQP